MEDTETEDKRRRERSTRQQKKHKHPLKQNVGASTHSGSVKEADTAAEGNKQDRTEEGQTAQR